MSTKELPKEILDKINSKYPYTTGDDSTSVSWNERAEIARRAATAWAKIAIGLQKFITDNKYVKHHSKDIYIAAWNNYSEHTVEDLLIEYIKKLQS